jgi:hypothetical protein
MRSAAWAMLQQESTGSKPIPGLNADVIPIQPGEDQHPVYTFIQGLPRWRLHILDHLSFQTMKRPKQAGWYQHRRF